MADEEARVYFSSGVKKEVAVEPGSTILDAVKKAGIELETTCGGEGECGKCKVIVDKGEASKLKEAHRKYFSKKEIEEGYRLACDTLVLSDLYVSVPVGSRREKTKILAESSVPVSGISPSVRKYGVNSKCCSSEGELQKELARLCGGVSPKFDYGSYKDILGAGKDVTVTVSETGRWPEVIGVEAGNRLDRNYGLAIDVGTTTVVAELVDLNTGAVLGRGSTLNKQITFGEALLSRVKHSATQQGLGQLQDAAVRSINEVVEKLLAESSVERENVYEACVGGNTVMNHLLAGKKADHFNDSKVKITTEPILGKARELGLNINPEARVYCLPNVSRWLGGDVTGDILASGLYKSGDISMLIDMGTNGEIVIGCSDWSVSCTVPSGPAFEGSGFKFGMRGQKGGIEHATIDPQSLVTKYRTIEEAKPRGICGSGAIDLLAEMYSAGVIDFCGNLQKRKTDRVRDGEDGGLEYVVAPADETEMKKDITITQKDVKYVIDSKATVQGGIKALLKKIGISTPDVKNLYLAGAFGNYMDLEKARTIGLLPELPNAKTYQIGNGSLGGAYIALVSKDGRREAEDVARKMAYFDLSADSDFLDAYMASLYIPGNDLKA